MNTILKKNNISSRIIKIKGLVQGVGFRPFIYRTALKYNISGWVQNKNDCVQIKVEGRKEIIKSLKNTSCLLLL